MYQRVGAAAYKANLDNTIALCHLLDNPQNAFKSLHITGTNGKGSVSHMLASVLQTAGFRTGLYTSPHLKDFRERIRVNGKKISQSYVTAFISKHRQDLEKLQLSFFEMTVGMAFQYFRDQQVDIAVIEVGLGGRLDSTNIIIPLVSVITNVSLDHMQFLGDSLGKIAVEKAGIIKPGIPVVIGETQYETKKIFLRKAKKLNAPILFADQVFTASRTQRNVKQKLLAGKLTRKGETFLPHFISPLGGLYQLKNIQTVAGVCEELSKLGVPVSKNELLKGLRNVIRDTGLKGRWQILSNRPLTICDTAHNAGGLRDVMAQIETLSHEQLHVVFGVVNDKHLEPILQILPTHATYYFCKPDIPRGLGADILKLAALSAGLKGKVYPTVKDALKAAQQKAGPQDLVFVGGSTFVVAEVV